MTMQADIEKMEKTVTKILNDSNSKIYNFFDKNYKNYKIDEALTILKDIYNEYKVLKMPSKQNLVLLQINSLYDKLYLHNFDRMYKKFQATNLKELLHLNEKNMTLRDDTLHYIELYIKISHESADENTYMKALEYVIKYYKDDDTKFDIVIKCYKEIYAITNEYKEEYGNILALNGDYKEAAEIYEHIGENSINKLTKFLCPNYFLKSIICYILHNDDVYTEIKLEKFTKDFIIIQHSSTYKFMIDITKCYLDNNIIKFTDSVIEYDTIKKLDDFYVKLLNSIKEKMKNTNIEDELT
jgi:tetratricopeptide (TPR) repeat protein